MDPGLDMINIISYGGGVNSTAMIIEMVNHNEPIDEVIFADTGTEMPETYAYLPIMNKWCEERGLKFTIVKSPHFPLYKYFLDKKLIPLRQFRMCTDKFKISPIKSYIYPNRKEGIVQSIGIAYNEIYRAVRMEANKRVPKYLKYRFPLCEWKMTRDDNINSIKKAGLPVPVKSGCYCCPFQSYKSWEELFNKHPDLFELANKLEINGRNYPRITLTFNKNLEEYKKLFNKQASVMEFVSNICDGNCYT